MQYYSKDIELKTVKLKQGTLRIISLESDYNIVINDQTWESIINAKSREDIIFFQDDREQSWFAENEGNNLIFRCNDGLNEDRFKIAKNQF